MKGFKGFNPDFTCKGKQYEENTVFKEDKAEICNNGMHFCEYPLGALGCYIALAEWENTDNGYVLKDFKSAKVDGKKIKENTFYKLVNGKFKEVEE